MWLMLLLSFGSLRALGALSCLRRKTVYRSFGMLDNNLLGPLSLIRAYNNPVKELMLHLRRS